MRRPIIAGNWKMFKTTSETSVYFQQFLPLIETSEHCDVVICPPFVSLPVAVMATQETRVEVGGQNLHSEREGAYTGEVSGAMLREAGAQWVIIGHSERRQYYGETDDAVNGKTCAAVLAGLSPIVCVGERLEEREAGETEEVLQRQFRVGIGRLTPEQFEEIVIAYEPVWAIGTGKTATPEMAADVHRLLRDEIREVFGDDAAAATQILYGGSVKPDNIKGLMAQDDIDGALVGGASLDPKSFASIVNY